MVVKNEIKHSKINVSLRTVTAKSRKFLLHSLASAVNLAAGTSRDGEVVPDATMYVSSHRLRLSQVFLCPTTFVETDNVETFYT